MATDRIDIEVTDKGADKAATSLRDLANAADKGYNYVTKLQKAMAAINATSLTKLTAASNAMVNALARETTAQAKLTTARAQAEVAASKAALSTQKLATETAKTEAASARAATAQTNAALAAQRLAAANAKTASAAAQAAPAEHALGASVAAAKAQFDAGEISIRRYIAAIQAANAAAVGGVAQGQTVLQHGETLLQQQQRLGSAMKGTGHQTANVIAQFNDLGVQFAMAAQSGEPLKMVFMALIQQGSQLAYVAGTMEKGWLGIAQLAGGLVVKFLPVIAVLGAVTMALKAMQAEAEQGAGLDKYVKSLGLTKDELKKLENQHVTFTDTVSALWTELSNNLLASVGLTTEEIANFWGDLSDKILYFMKAAFVGIAGMVRSLVLTVAKSVANMGIAFYNAGRAAFNGFVMWIEKLVNNTIDGINKIGGAINWLSSAAGMGSVVGTLDHIDLGIKGVGQGMLKAFSVDPVKDFQDGALNALGTINRATARAADNARNRLGKAAAAMIADRDPAKGTKGKKGPKEKVDHTAENRAQALKLVNNELDNELSRMKMLKDERAVQERMDQIEQSLLQKKITLDKTEKQGILDKIKAVEAYKYVQTEMDRIYEETIAPARTLNATTQAATALFLQGKLSLAAYNQELEKAKTAFTAATDPLHTFTEALEAQKRTAGLYGDALEQANYQETIRQALVAKGFAGDALAAELASKRVQNLMAENAALAQQNYIKSQVAAVAAPFMEEQKLIDNKVLLYAELERLRQADILSEDNYKKSLAALDAKYRDIQLRDVNGFFGELAGLAGSGYSELAAIGKAAAITQATINMFAAASEALRLPFPANLPAIAKVIATGAGILSQIKGTSTNVGSYATGGQFTVGGKSGVDANNINMNVTKGERVTIETAKQQRANDNQKGGTTVIKKTTVANYFDEASFLAALDSSEGDDIIMNSIRRNRSDTNQILGTGGNS